VPVQTSGPRRRNSPRAYSVAKANGLLAIVHCQLGCTLRQAGGFLVIGDWLFGLGDGIFLILVHVGPQPALDNDFVGHEHITSQSETGVQKILVVLAGGVHVLHQTEQANAVKIYQLGFDVAPSGGGFVLVCHDIVQRLISKSSMRALVAIGWTSAIDTFLLVPVMVLSSIL
jgi:hypothetical protein